MGWSLNITGTPPSFFGWISPLSDTPKWGFGPQNQGVLHQWIGSRENFSIGNQWTPSISFPSFSVGFLQGFPIQFLESVWNYQWWNPLDDCDTSSFPSSNFRFIQLSNPTIKLHQIAKSSSLLTQPFTVTKCHSTLRTDGTHQKWRTGTIFKSNIVDIFSDVDVSLPLRRKEERILSLWVSWEPRNTKNVCQADPYQLVSSNIAGMDMAALATEVSKSCWENSRTQRNIFQQTSFDAHNEPGVFAWSVTARMFIGLACASHPARQHHLNFNWHQVAVSRSDCPHYWHQPLLATPLGIANICQPCDRSIGEKPSQLGFSRVKGWLWHRILQRSRRS